MDHYSPIVQNALTKMTDEQRLAFESEYNRCKRSVGAMMALAILFPIQLFLLDKVALGVLLWVTLGGFGIWWIIEIFLTPKRVREYNDQIAMNLAHQTSMLG